MGYPKVVPLMEGLVRGRRSTTFYASESVAAWTSVKKPSLLLWNVYIFCQSFCTMRCFLYAKKWNEVMGIMW
jgi:hypothetical protein